MILSRSALKNIQSDSVIIPDQALFELPEKVLQFGTGVLLRGLPDYFIDRANRQGVFNGRVVIVKSTAQGDTSDFARQDGLYTVCIRGIDNGEKTEQNIINSSVSRVLSAQDEWNKILDCALNPHMQIIISNTTEVGIQLTNDDVHMQPPVSFPGKLLAFLYKRFESFKGSRESGMVIIPTELIPDNGRKLESIVLELAHLNSLEDEFIEWLENSNRFCNSLVDRIVPGKPQAAVLHELEKEFGYTDRLLLMCELYSLWAIEGDEKVKNILSFANVGEGVMIEPNIEIFRELKLRLLNGTHTMSCGVAFLAGCQTVKEAMDDETVSTYISTIMQQEIAPSIPYNIPGSVVEEFSNKVLDRFRNPQIQHNWINITVQYSSKIKMRCIPVLMNHYKQKHSIPELFAIGFAAYLMFMKAVEKVNGQYYGESNGRRYLIQDDRAAIFYKRWTELSVNALVEETMDDDAFWGEGWVAPPAFKQAISEHLHAIITNGMKDSLEQLYKIKVVAAG
jgi:tagaturonate reductase